MSRSTCCRICDAARSEILRQIGGAAGSEHGPRETPPPLASESAHREITLACEPPVAIKRCGFEMRLVLESGAPKEAKVDRVLLKEVSRARRCFKALLRAGRAQRRFGLECREATCLPRSHLPE